VDMQKMSHAGRIYAAKAVTIPVVANVIQEKTAGWFNFILFCLYFVLHTLCTSTSVRNMEA